MSSCQPRREAGQGFALYTSCDIGEVVPAGLGSYSRRRGARGGRSASLQAIRGQDNDAAARMISIIDYGPYFAGARGALECVFFYDDRAPDNIYTLSLHDALPI